MLCILSKHFGDKYLLPSLIQQMFIEVLLFTKHCSTDPPGIEQGTWWKTHTHTHTHKPALTVAYLNICLLFWPPDTKSQLIGKDPDAGKDWRHEEKVMIEDEMVGWHHQLSEQEFKQTPGDREGQGRLDCFNSWDGRVRYDLATEQKQFAE